MTEALLWIMALAAVVLALSLTCPAGAQEQPTVGWVLTDEPGAELYVGVAGTKAIYDKLDPERLWVHNHLRMHACLLRRGHPRGPRSRPHRHAPGPDGGVGAS